MSKKKKEDKAARPLRQIHVLRSIVTGSGVYQPGATLVIGRDIAEKTAWQWIAAGVAEEDKILGGTPETKWGV